MAREIKTKATTYLRVNGDGKLYASSKEAREGFTEYTTSKGNVRFRKIFAGTEIGKITGLGIEEATFPTGKIKFLSISVENDGYRDVVQLPLKDTKGRLNTIVKKFIAVLPTIDFSRDLTISSSKKVNERNYEELVLFVNYASKDGSIDKSALKFGIKFGKDGDVPGYEVKDGIDGVEYDFTKQDKYLYEVLLSQIERLKAFKSNSDESSAPTPAPTVSNEATTDKKVESPKNIIDEDDDDDLPF